MKELVHKLRSCGSVVVFSGAGVSTLCGIPDFRGPQGLYREKDAERIFDIDWFYRDPSIYYRGSRRLVYGTRDVRPGPVHAAVALLEKVGVVAGVVTQNIDMLHQKAGSRVVFEVHGSGLVHRCVGCGREKSFEAICGMLDAAGTDDYVPRCESCESPYKPDITFFGEALPEKAFSGAVEIAARADLVLVLGSSLTVYPAASIPLETLRAGGEMVIVNAQPTPMDRLATLLYTDLSEFAEVVLKEFAVAGQ